MPFGNEPLEDIIILSLGADFTQVLDVPAGEFFPNGTTVEMRLYLPNQRNTLNSIAEWPATVTPDSATWIVQSDEADLIPNKARYRIYVSYPESPSLEHCWYIGQVVRKQ